MRRAAWAFRNKARVRRARTSSRVRASSWRRSGLGESGRIAISPRIFGQVVEPVNESVQRRVDVCALLANGGEVVSLAERLVVKGQKRFKRFLRSLLAMEQRVLHVRRFRREASLDSLQVLPCLPFRGPAAVFRSKLGSIGIKEYAFADDRGRKQTFQMQLRLEASFPSTV